MSSGRAHPSRPLDVVISSVGGGMVRASFARSRLKGVFAGVDLVVTVEELAEIGEAFSKFAAEAEGGPRFCRWRTGEKAAGTTGLPGSVPSATSKSK